jgi:hypothetical protein
MSRLAATWIGYLAFCLLTVDGAALGAPDLPTSVLPMLEALERGADGQGSESDAQPWLSSCIQSDGGTEPLPDDEPDRGASPFPAPLAERAEMRALPGSSSDVGASRAFSCCASRAPPLV